LQERQLPGGRQCGQCGVALTLGRDINQFRDLTQALLAGSDALRLAATTDPEARNRLQELTRVYGEFQNSIAGAIGSLQAIVQSKEAELAILRDSEPLRQQVTELGGLFTKEQAARTVALIVMAFFGIGMLLSAFAIVKVLRKTRASARRSRDPADAGGTPGAGSQAHQRAEPGRHSSPDERVAGSAGRHLTVQARCPRHYGAIADSVNYTWKSCAPGGRINNPPSRSHGINRRARHRHATADGFRSPVQGDQGHG